MSRSWDDTGDVRGELHLGCFVTFSPYYVPGLLRVFKERHPNVTVRLHEGDADALQRGIASGTLDVALVYDMALGAEFGRETLAELRPYALLPCDHALAEQEQVSLAALAAEPIVLLDLPISGAYFRSIFLRAGLEPEARYRTASFEMVRGLVANGHGVAILNLPLPQDRSYDGRPFAIRRLADPVPPLRIVLARLRRARMTRAAEVFAACARDYFSRVASVDRPFAE
jgi:DNA-binding transcriptional LysR family regulator